jgi:DNA-binding NarL/FixJ family response regulator
VDEHPLVQLFEVEPLLVIALFGGAFLLFALGMVGQGREEMKIKSAVIVDDDPDIRRGLKMIIENRTPFAVVGEAADGALALKILETVVPDVVVVDVKLPHVDGIQLTRHIRENHPSVRVVAYSSPEDDATGAIMRRAGACAHLVKGDPPERIIEALLDVA